MGQIYLKAEQIPGPDAHAEFTSAVLRTLENNLLEGEGGLIVGSYARGTWNVRSDIDVFMHTPSRERA